MVGNSQLIPLLTLFRQDVVHIIDAVLHNRRVLFVGHMSSMLSSDVCNAVLATCTLFSPPFVSMLTKCYPYANLTDLSFLEAPNGYVAGVTNPMFKSKETWWDLMCDMETGKCIHSPHSPVHGSGGGSGGGGGRSNSKSRSNGKQSLSRYLSAREVAGVVVLTGKHGELFTVNGAWLEVWLDVWRTFFEAVC
jgi:hypothetical protein